MKYLFIVFLFLPALLKAGIGADTIKKNNDTSKNESKKNDIYIEVLGPGIAYSSLNYMRFFLPGKTNLFVRAGFGYARGGSGPAGCSCAERLFSFPFSIGIKFNERKKVYFEFALGTTYHTIRTIYYDYHSNADSIIKKENSDYMLFFAAGGFRFKLARTFFIGLNVYGYWDFQSKSKYGLDGSIIAWPTISFGKLF